MTVVKPEGWKHTTDRQRLAAVNSVNRQQAVTSVQKQRAVNSVNRQQAVTACTDSAD